MSLYISSALTFFFVAALLLAQLPSKVHAWQQCGLLELGPSKICPNNSNGNFDTCDKPTTIRNKFLTKHCKLDRAAANDVEDALFHNCELDSLTFETSGPNCCLGVKSLDASLSLVSAVRVKVKNKTNVKLRFNFVVPYFVDKSTLYYGFSNESSDFLANITTNLLVKGCNIDTTMSAGSFNLTIDMEKKRPVELNFFNLNDKTDLDLPIWTGTFSIKGNTLEKPEISKTVWQAGLLVTATAPTTTSTPSSMTASPARTPMTPTPTVTSQPTSETQTSSPTDTEEASEDGSMTVLFAVGGGLLLLALIVVCLVKRTCKKTNEDKPDGIERPVSWEYAADNPLRETSHATNSVSSARSFLPSRFRSLMLPMWRDRNNIGLSVDSRASEMPTKRLESGLPVATPL